MHNALHLVTSNQGPWLSIGSPPSLSVPEQCQETPNNVGEHTNRFGCPLTIWVSPTTVRAPPWWAVKGCAHCILFFISSSWKQMVVLVVAICTGNTSSAFALPTSVHCGTSWTFEYDDLVGFLAREVPTHGLRNCSWRWSVVSGWSLLLCMLINTGKAAHRCGQEHKMTSSLLNNDVIIVIEQDDIIVIEQWCHHRYWTMMSSSLLNMMSSSLLNKMTSSLLNMMSSCAPDVD